MSHILAYDIGTTGVKTCLFAVESSIELVASADSGYSLNVLENGGVEQNVDEWWAAMCETTRALFADGELRPQMVAGIAICSQMQGLVLVDRDGQALRPAMSYMDQRAGAELKAGIANGLQVAGANVFKLLPSLFINGAVASSVKDPVWKYKWVEKHEPEIFAQVHKWLDVKEYLIARCTGNFVMTKDTAFSTFLYDTRAGKERWSDYLCKMLGVRREHLPQLVNSTDQAGTLNAVAADELGLVPNTPVFGGGGDASMIGVGAGCTQLGDTHIYSGTSGWVSTVVPRRMVDAGAMIAAIVGAQPNSYNYFAEMETAGKCLEWARDHLALDEIDIYLEKRHVAESPEAISTSLYDYLTKTIRRVAPGSGGVIFTPWLHGNRCPFEDPAAAGIFFNVRLETGKTELIRAMLEGVGFHLRWMLECQAKKVPIKNSVRFVGGGALSDVSCQILADILDKTVESVRFPQNVGAVGAAAVAAVGLGQLSSLAAVKDMISVSKSYRPTPENKAVYDRNYHTFTRLYKSNRKNFRMLNAFAAAAPDGTVKTGGAAAASEVNAPNGAAARQGDSP